MTLRLNGDSSGFTEIKAADAAGDNSIKLPASNGSANQLLQNGGTAGELQYTNAGGGLHYDSSGRLLVGTSSGYGIASSGLAKFQVGSTGAELHASLTDWSTFNQGGILAFGAARGGAAGNFTIVQNGDNLGALRFAGADGTDLQTQGAAIAAQVDGTPGTDVMPGKLTFSTNAGGAAPTPRVEIGSNGALKLLAGCPGIDFSGIQTNAAGMISETLDSYEEGTWTPTIFATTGTQPTISYLHRDGFYTKIGNIVYVSLIFTTNSISGGTGTSGIIFTGLPFAASSSGYYNIHRVNVAEALSMAGNKQLYEITATITGEVPSRATSIGTNFALSEFGTGGTANRIRMNGWYRV